jgi:hypothetical protein
MRLKVTAVVAKQSTRKSRVAKHIFSHVTLRATVPSIELDETKRQDFGIARETKGKLRRKFHEILQQLGMEGKPASEVFGDVRVKSKVLKSISDYLKELGATAEQVFRNTYGNNVTQWFSNPDPVIARKGSRRRVAIWPMKKKFDWQAARKLVEEQAGQTMAIEKIEKFLKNTSDNVQATIDWMVKVDHTLVAIKEGLYRIQESDLTNSHEGSVSLYCPNCGENLGKDTECSNPAYCSTCGQDNIKNPRGYK